MAYSHKPDHGNLFINTDKEKPTQPDYTGTYALPDGTVRRVAAWIKKSKSGDEYLSLSFQDQYDAKKAS